MSTALTLYDLEGELTELLSILDADAGEDEASLLKVLDDIAEKHEAAVAKRDNTIRFLQSVKAAIQLHKDEETRVRKRRQALENGLKRTEEYLIGIIEEHGTIPKGKKSKCLEGSVGTLAIQPNPENVAVKDVNLLPWEMLDVVILVHGEKVGEVLDMLTETGIDNKSIEFKPRKRDIKAALDNNDSVPGADLKPGGYSLRIR